MSSPGLAFCNAASARLRKSIAAVLSIESASSASMSKSSRLALYLVITFWYWACSFETLVHTSASSNPAAPPKEKMASPPAARMLLTYPVRRPSEETDPSPPHVAVQLLLLAASMKANVRNLSPAACASADSSKPRLTSWYGATRFSVAAGLSTTSPVALSPAFPATATAASHDRLQAPRQLEKN